MKVAPLHSAVSARHGEVVALLLERGADPNARQQEGWTALHGAAHNGDAETVEALLLHGADPALRHEGGKRAADLAGEAGHDALARRLEAAR
jgi:ankyrin repeat protein